jgi:hypothetical protein
MSNQALKHAIAEVGQQTAMNLIVRFWTSVEGKKKTLTQLERYQAAKSPDYITKFIAMGGGPKMGNTLEEFARFKFKTLQKRSKGAEQTGYDHLLTVNGKTVYVEQKSSGHWGQDDYKWQHVEDKHKWTMLLLTGIDYTDIKFWGMNRKTFQTLVNEGVITNQGNKAADSSEGRWFNYSDVVKHLVPIETDEDLKSFAETCQAESGESKLTTLNTQ